MKRALLYPGVSSRNSTRVRLAVLCTLIGAGLVFLAPSSAQAQNVAQLWQKNCMSCHGKDAKGNTKAGKKVGVIDLTTLEARKRSSDEEMFRSVKEGISEDGRVRMKPAEGLSDVEIKMLVAFVRNLQARQ